MNILATNILATRALAGQQGYFGSFQHHPERCPMLLFINSLASAQLQPARMQEKTQRSQDKQSQQHPRMVGRNAERAKDAPAEPPSPGLPGGMDMPWHRSPGAGLRQHKAARPPWVHPRVPGLPRSRWGAAGRLPRAAPSAGPSAQCQGPTCVAQKCPCPAQGSAELLWGTAELQPPWDPRDAAGWGGVPQIPAGAGATALASKGREGCKLPQLPPSC